MGICPLYHTLHRADRQLSNAGNAGLWFDKFPELYNDKPSGQEEEEASKQEKFQWLKTLQKLHGNEGELRHYARRLVDLAARFNGASCEIVNESRFASGLGREHPVGNGLAWHYSLGVPYLPGSSIKGMLRSWMRCENDGQLANWLGAPGQVGAATILDMVPVAPVRLVVDVMTPHYGPYYQEGEAPGDWHSPIPIPFLACEAGNRWQIAVLPASTKIDAKDCSSVLDMLQDALAWQGAGAKTAVGYGRFVKPEEFVAAQAPSVAQPTPASRSGPPKRDPGTPVKLTLIELKPGKSDLWKVKETSDSTKVGGLKGAPPAGVEPRPGLVVDAFIRDDQPRNPQYKWTAREK